MVVEFFNLLYFVFIGLFVLLYFGLNYICKKLNDKQRYYFIWCIFLFGITLHFSKLLFEPYRSDFPYSFRKVTFENICAVSTLIFPFVYISKNKLLKDYMYYLGVISGTLAMLVPTECLGKNPFCFDMIRFYICHMIIAIGPFLMVKYKIHTLDVRRILAVPLVFFAVLGIILVNEIILIEGGFVNMRNLDFMNPNYRNSSFIFGPLPGFEEVSKIITVFTPKCFKEVMIGEFAGQVKYTPILWLVIPAYIYFPIIFLLMNLGFNTAQVKKFFLNVKVFFKNCRLKLVNLFK